MSNATLPRCRDITQALVAERIVLKLSAMTIERSHRYGRVWGIIQSAELPAKYDRSPGRLHQLAADLRY